MRFVMFYHSLVSDWNHGNAHFLRGIATELLRRGHTVEIYEPEQGWSYRNLVAEHGDRPVSEFRSFYSHLHSTPYDPASLNLDEALRHADVVMVHEWNPPEFIARIGEHRRNGGRYRLLFHDTHHRAVSQPGSLGVEHLRLYDDVLAFGESLRRVYVKNRWAKRVWTWHEAADVRVFRPGFDSGKDGDLVWVGNWGDGERSAELEEFLLKPVRSLRLRARVHGVRFPDEALSTLTVSGIEYAGWIPNFKVPETFARFRMTIHIPRRQYRTMLPGIPTIRVFEALACGIPLICAPWDDCEHLFQAGSDYLLVRNRDEAQNAMSELFSNARVRAELAARGLRTIRQKHTCAHRTDQLMEVLEK